MTTEEKAKAYDEALERARKIHDEIVNNEVIGFPGQITDIFPELRESEDERIRTVLCDIVRDMPYIETELRAHGLSVEKTLAYLEKQKESLHIPETCKENADSFTDDDRLRKLIIDRIRTSTEMPDGLRELILTYLEKQKDSVSNAKYIEDVAHAFEDGRKKGIEEKQKEQKPNIELIQRSWYMEGYHDGKFKQEPKWILKTGEGGPYHEPNPRYGQPLDEQKPVEQITDAEIKCSMDAVTKFKVFAADLAKTFNIAHKRDIDWHNFCAGLLTYLERNKPVEWSEILGIKAQNLYQRKHRGWDDERILNTPVKQKK